ncbi:MAG: TIGR03557 family F420-dependent LLM class oxidoreductase [Alphaproteobacteria bacterium]
MIKLGYKLMSEEHGPQALVRNAVRAEEVGMDFAAISDHFFPWVEEQGHSPLCWPILGSIASMTEKLGLMTAVTAPVMRYHPAIVAQAAATVGLLSDDRFTLGLGSGERLNEHVVGLGWPGIVERRERLSEAIDIIQGLLAGKMSNYRGKHFMLDNARLYDRPEKKVPVALAAGGPKAAKLAATKTDGFISTEADTKLTGAYRDAGGTGPLYAEVAMCWDDNEERAKQTAHKFFRWAFLGGWAVNAELPDTKGFGGASQHVTPETVATKMVCGADVSRHVAAVKTFVDAGYDHIILLQVGPDQESFFKAFEQELAPALRKL